MRWVRGRYGPSPNRSCGSSISGKTTFTASIPANTTRSRPGTRPQSPGFIVPDGSAFIVGLKSGLHLTFAPETGAFSLLYPVDADKPGNRLNDGARDPSGSPSGSARDGQWRRKRRLAVLYRPRSRRARKAVDSGICITNGPCFSPDGKTLYHTDTLKKTIYAFDLADDGSLSGKRAWVTIEDGAGYPDGSVTDAEGCVWVGLYAGWAARRYAPDGKLISAMRFPCANITKLAFGGPDLENRLRHDRLEKGLSVAERGRNSSLAGGLFRFESDVAGNKS